MVNSRSCQDVICTGALATHVDTFVLSTTFVPLRVPQSVHTPPDGRAPGQQPGKDNWGKESREGHFKATLRLYIEREMQKAVRIPTAKEIARSIEIAIDKKVPGASQLADAARAFVDSEAERICALTAKDLRARVLHNLEDDGKSVMSAPTLCEALERIGRQYGEKNHVFLPGYLQRTIRRATTKEILAHLPDIGLLFLERVRIRPIGYTLERAPFYELSIEPGEVVTLRQKSFSKRSGSFEEVTEASKEQQMEYLSAFTTELSEEYSTSQTDSSNWGVNTLVSGTYGNPAKGSVTGELGGNYGASADSTDTFKEVSSRSQSLSRKIASSQKMLHKTTVTIATENTLEDESIKVITNTDTRAKKIFMRKLMQVLHLSQERYGVRFCWAPYVREPGKDVRQLIPGPGSFPDAIQEIRDKWNATPPPEELGPGPTSQTVAGEWTGKLSGGAGGLRDDNARHQVAIPTGYQYSDAYLETKEKDGSPNVYIKSKPSRGDTGVVTVVVHVGLSGGFDAENINYRVCVVAEPGPDLLAQREAAVAEWRRQKMEEEIQQFMQTKREEVKDVPSDAWPQSELMRRVIAEHFGPGISDANCHLLSMLQTMFEWENLSFELHAPWWIRSTPVNGLQSLRTTFLNASYAQVFIPIRPGFEEKALLCLLGIGALPNNQRLARVIEYYLRDMRVHLEPQFASGQSFDRSATKEIDSPCDIHLTDLGQQQWANKFEEDTGFITLARWTETIPTDGVDYETQFARCDASTPMRDANERDARAKTALTEALSSRIQNGDGQIQINVASEHE